MGVKGLQYFTEEHCTDVCYPVSIRDLAVDYKNNHPRIQPTIVVDGSSLLHCLYRDKLEWLYGGQYLQFVDILRDFVSRFKQIGIKLVFIFDGCVVSTKRPEWLNRQLDNIRVHDEIYRDLKTNHLPVSDDKFRLPGCTFMVFALKYILNVDVFNSSAEEADLVIAQYAKYNESVFAILARDTDYFIYNTKCYLSAQHLNLDNMTTILCDRNALAKKLSLSISQLPLLSCLLGNDIISKDILKPFQFKLCCSTGDGNTKITNLAPAVSDLIKKKQWTGDINNESECVRIARLALGGEDNLELLRNGLELYLLRPISHILGENLVETKHVLVENFPTIYKILCTKEYESGLVLEDSTDRSLPPTAIAFKDINLRCYFILFSGQTNISITEWLAYATNQTFLRREPNVTSPVPIQIEGAIVTLENLWSNDPNFDNIRMDYFFKCLDIPISKLHLKNIPMQYTVLCCLLNYMLSKFPKILQMWEVLAFIVQAVQMQTIRVKDLYKLKITYVEPRAVHLASFFHRGMHVVGLALNTCGFPFPLSVCFPWTFFDGKLFHQAYCQAKHNADLKHLCKDWKEAAEVSKILWVVVYGTSLEEKKQRKIN